MNIEKKVFVLTHYIYSNFSLMNIHFIFLNNKIFNKYKNLIKK